MARKNLSFLGILFFLICPFNRMDSEEESGKWEKRVFFISLISDPDPSIRWKAIEALARDGNEAAVDPIITALGDEDWRVRQKAAWALGYMGFERALQPLRSAIRGEREGVKEMITEAIEEIIRKNQ